MTCGGAVSSAGPISHTASSTLWVSSVCCSSCRQCRTLMARAQTATAGAQTALQELGHLGPVALVLAPWVSREPASRALDPRGQEA